jgi:hypothetical protein
MKQKQKAEKSDKTVHTSLESILIFASQAYKEGT